MTWINRVIDLLNACSIRTDHLGLESGELLRQMPYWRGGWILQVTDHGGATRLYGTFQSRDEAEAYAARRMQRRCNTAPVITSKNHTVMYVVPTTKAKRPKR